VQHHETLPSIDMLGYLHRCAAQSGSNRTGSRCCSSTTTLLAKQPAALQALLEPVTSKRRPTCIHKSTALRFSTLKIIRCSYLYTTDMRFGTWNVRSLDRAGSLTAAARQVARYKLDLMGVQEARWDKGAQ